MSKKMMTALAEINDIAKIETVLIWAFDPGSTGKITIYFAGAYVRTVTFDVTTLKGGKASVNLRNLSTATQISANELAQIASVMQTFKSFTFDINEQYILRYLPAGAHLNFSDDRRIKVAA